MQNFIFQNGIENIYHFTRVENLYTILFSGLVARSDLDFMSAEYIINDYQRLDESLGSISCSISFPQYQMLYSKKKSIPGSKWIVIELSPNVLLEKECLFCHTNAASNSVKNTPLEQKKGMIGLINMFAEREGKKSRKEMGLPLHYPTDPQAEILVKTVIQADYIKRIIFESEEDLNDYGRPCIEKLIKRRRKYKSHIDFVVDRNYFKPRLDYKYWGKNNGEKTGVSGWE